MSTSPLLFSAALLFSTLPGARLLAQAIESPATLDHRPAFAMGATLGTGVSFSPLEVAVPLTARLEATAGLSVGGLMRGRNPGTPLAGRTLQRLRYRTTGGLAVGLRAYARPDRAGAYLGGGLSVRHYTLRATTREATLAGLIADALFAPLTLFGNSFDNISNRSTGLHVGAYGDLGYAYRTRRGRRHAFGLRLDAAPVAGTRYVLTDRLPRPGGGGGTELRQVTRDLGEDFTTAGLGARVYFRFEL